MKRKSKISKFKTFLILSLSLFFIRALGDLPTLTDAPLNPEFIRYMKSIERGDFTLISDDGYWLGEIPAPVDLSHIKNVNEDIYFDSYPVTYDLRTLDKLTAVRNQGACGSCWAFATYASLESYGKPLNNWNFSEQDLNANHGFDYAVCAGGQHFMSTAYLSRWDGPLSESDVPYPYGVGIGASVNGFSPKKHVQQVVFLPQRSNSLDNDTIKYYVTTYGAVHVSFYYSSTYIDISDLNYYCYDTTSTNHGVAVVGWDDNYDKSNFKTTPPGNGAFIIKNSWGTGRHDNGYFYLSYYDTSFKPRASFNNAESPDKYERIYQYDPLGWVSSYGYGNTVAWGANVFTAADNRPLRAVAFYTTDVNTGYTIYIYTGVSGTDPRSGVLAATKTGSQTCPGYYTAELDSPVSLNTEEKFSVVIQFSNTSYTYPVPVEKAYAGYSSAATANAGESYISSSGSGWYDMSQDGYNACITAFASTYAPYQPDPDFNNDGNADIIWRYYGTGGYNAVWLRGSLINLPSTLSFNGSLSINSLGIVDMDNIELIGKKGAVDRVDMNLLILGIKEQNLEDGFEGYKLAQDEPKLLSDPFDMEKSNDSRLVSRVMASTVADPRNDPEAVELPSTPNTLWKLCGTGDFNNDGQVDLVWRHVGDGRNAVWFMDGVTMTGVALLPSAANLNWTLCGTGDFNNDGRVDLVWRHVGDGRNAVWFMDGVTMTGVALLPSAANLNWTLCGAGDFNNDGRVDLAWRHAGDGRNAVWFMDGVTMTGVALLPSAVNLNWTLCGAGDFNNDRKVDLLWRNVSNGKNAIWYLDGVNRTSVELLTTVTNTDWKIEN